MNTSYLGILDINTQVRRLGVISAIVKLLGHEALSERALLQRIYRWAKTPEIALSFANKTGKVVISEIEKPAATKRYLQFALSAKLVVRLTGMYRNTQLGRVLLPFLTNQESIDLSVAERLFYGYVLLTVDSDVLLTIIAQLRETPNSTLAEYQGTFQQRHIHWLNTRIESTSSVATQQDLLQKRQQIESTWKNPTKYAEHIVPPRVNWLVDLGLAEAIQTGHSDLRTRKRMNYRLSPSGDCWSEQVLSAMHSPNQSDVFEKWAYQKYFSICHLCQWPTPSTKARTQHDLVSLAQNVRVACETHKKQLIKRIPLQQILLHSAITSLVNDGIVYDLTEIANLMQAGLPLLDGSVDTYLIRTAARTNEEYVLPSQS